MYGLVSLVLYILVAVATCYYGAKLLFKIKTKLEEREFEVNPSAFKGFVREQRAKANYWNMVKAYQKRAIKRLGWEEE